MSAKIRYTKHMSIASVLYQEERLYLLQYISVSGAPFCIWNMVSLCFGPEAGYSGGKFAFF